VITFPNAKINLGLNIVEKRPDGYHNLETVFYPIPLEDALEIHTLNHQSEKNENKCILKQSGIKISGNPETNLVVKAYRLLDEQFHLPPVEFHLFKHIPSGAGLGGGSADAAFTLKLLNDKFELELTYEELEEFAGRLGADCAFFISNSPVYAEGIGNIFFPITLSLKDYQIIIIKPDIFVSTREAFAKITPRHPERSLKEIIRLPVEQWKETMVNDFEASVFSAFPAIGEIKEELYRQGALYASMSGSGSSVFGIFPLNVELPKTAFKEEKAIFRFNL